MEIAKAQDGIRDLARSDFSFYLEYVHRGLYVPANFHYLICEKLQRIEKGELKKLMIFMPPRHGKSMTVTESFPSYFLGRNPNKRVIAVAYGDSLARRFGRKNRQKIEEYGADLFNVQLAADNASVTDWGLKEHNGGMLSCGIGASITGHGADLLLLDDPIRNREQASSEVIRNKIYEEYQSSLLTRLHSGGAIILIMTRWHEDDLAGRILATEQGWEVVSLPAEAEEGDLLDREVGEPLWEAGGFDKEWIEEKKKAVGQQAWNSIYQERPSAAEGNVIKRQWLNYYKQQPPKYDEMLISVDASFKDGKKSDFCVLQVWGKKGAEKYLVDQIRDRMNFPSTVNALRGLVARYPKASVKLIEDKANGSAIIDFLKKEISGIIPITPKESKEARLAAVSPEFESGSVFFPDPSIAPWIGACVEELVTFPNGKNDDQVDCISQALQRWQQPHTIWIGRA
jgi:predicted phage terminase large subunit-like protein